MVTVITIQGNIITIEGATEKDFKLNVDLKMASIKDYCFNWEQILYVRFIDEEEGKE